MPPGKGQETLPPTLLPSQVRRAAFGEGWKAPPLTRTGQKPFPFGDPEPVQNRKERKGRTTLACEGGRLGRLLLLLSPKPGHMSERVRRLSVPKETLLVHRHLVPSKPA